jgi:hypothetical protein
LSNAAGGEGPVAAEDVIQTLATESPAVQKSIKIVFWRSPVLDRAKSWKTASDTLSLSVRERLRSMS